MNRGITAVVVAAGSGQRLGWSTPKAFVEVAGRPMLWHAARALVDAGLDSVVVVVGADWLDRAQQVVGDAGLDEPTVCLGGATRHESVAQGLRRCPPQAEVVAVHDAARPLASAALIRRAVAGLTEPWAACAPAMPVVDTVKLVDDERVLRTLDRRFMRLVQTPQVFDRASLERAHAELPAMATSDDLGLLEALGEPVRLVSGERWNLKVTYPEDLDLAEALLSRRAPA